VAGYQQILLSALITQILSLLDDSGGLYWQAAECQFAIWEALRVFGATTAFYRQRGTFNIKPTDPNAPYYDMSALLPALRSRSWSLGQMVTEIQYHLLENPSGIGGAGASGQIPIIAILAAIQRARNRFVIDCRLPNAIHPNFQSVSPPNGLVQFPQSSVFVHRVAWQDAGGGWANLWRDDAWVFDHSDETWPVDPGMPEAYSEAELSPLQLQMYPPPQNAGTLEAVTVDSLLIDTSNAASTFNIPDEWTHAVKYAAMEELLTGGNQLTDQLRAQYCGQRYQQAVAFARDARSIIRITCNGNPLPIDSMAAMDAGQCFWRNQAGPPQMAGILYDIAIINPATPDQQYGMGADLVTPAPLPGLNQYVPIGEENLQDIIDYSVNYLLLKCGGVEFKSTMSLLDNFQRAMATRKGVNAAKIRYFEPLFGQWQREQSMRPDAKMAPAGGK
jgi:hypothetical protein